MTLAAWSFRGTALNQMGFHVRAIQGMTALPPLRGSDFLTPGVPGQLFVPKIADSRRIALAILATDTRSAAVSTYLDTLARLFSPRTQGDLVLTHPDGTTRTAKAEAIAWTPGDLTMIHAIYAGVVDFHLADPYFYGAEVDNTQAFTATPTAMTVTNSGTAEGPGPQGQLILDYVGTGTIVNPRFTNSTTGAWVEVDVTVAAGKHLIVDCVAITALNDGVNVIGNVTHSGQLQLMSLVPGANTIAVTAVPTPSGSLTVKHKDIYL